MGFEFGYSAADLNALVLWEGQYGRFLQRRPDRDRPVYFQFRIEVESEVGAGAVVASWPGRREGRSISSARLERYLQLCGENNMQVVYISTPAQYFHCLRRQLKGALRGKLYGRS